MGVKTAEEIITEGVRLAGREYDADDTRPLTDLIEWLSSVALGWPWPETMASVTVTLAAGARALAMGGNSLVYLSGYRIIRVNFPLEIMYGPDMYPDKIYQEAFNKAYDNYDVGEGNPTKASYQRNVLHPGNTLLVFNKKPISDIRIHVPYQFDPSPDITIESIPWYPNDLTIKESVAYYTARHHDGPDAKKTKDFEDSLALMVRNDKVKFGVIDSFSLKVNRNPRNT